MTYAYDALGRRAEQTENGVVTRFMYNSNGNLWAQVSSANAPEVVYLMGDRANQVLGMGQSIGGGWTSTYVQTDNLGSVRDVIVSSGTLGSVLDHNDYSAYGVQIRQTNAAYAGSLGYTGESYDAYTQLVCAGNGTRYYTPATGTWMSADPTGFGAGQANFYQYVGNGPTNATDPSGLDGGDLDIVDINVKSGGTTFKVNITGDIDKNQISRLVTVLCNVRQILSMATSFGLGDFRKAILNWFNWKKLNNDEKLELVSNFHKIRAYVDDNRIYFVGTDLLKRTKRPLTAGHSNGAILLDEKRYQKLDVREQTWVILHELTHLTFGSDDKAGYVRPAFSNTSEGVTYEGEGQPGTFNKRDEINTADLIKNADTYAACLMEAFYDKTTYR